MSSIRFIQTKTLSPSCLLPCPLPPLISLIPGGPQQLSLAIPFMAKPLRAGGSITLKGGCGDCSISIDLFAKINPYILSLGLPLCILQCAGSLVTLAMDGVKLVVGSDFLSPPLPSDPDPNPGIISVVTGLAKVPPDLPSPEGIEAIGKRAVKVGEDGLKVAQDCRCVIDLLLPSGICLYIKFVRDLLRLVAALIRCFTTLLGDILRISLTADIMRISPSLRVQKHGICLGQLARNQLNNASLSFDVVWAICLVTESIFKLAAIIPGNPLAGVFDAIAHAIDVFQQKASGHLHTDIDLTIPDATNLKNDLNDVAAALDLAAAPLSMVVDALCP